MQGQLQPMGGAGSRSRNLRGGWRMRLSATHNHGNVIYYAADVLPVSTPTVWPSLHDTSCGVDLKFSKKQDQVNNADSAIIVLINH